MPKIVNPAFAATLTILAVSIWLKTGAVETTAGVRPDPAAVSVADLLRGVDMNSMRATHIDDRSVIFTAP